MRSLGDFSVLKSCGVEFETVNNLMVVLYLNSLRRYYTDYVRGKARYYEQYILDRSICRRYDEAVP